MKFSIIIPVYNVENYLRKCVDSVLQQSYKNIEIILVDDGSTDASSLICEEYAKKDIRVKVIHTSNKGVVAARKTGITLASGKYIVGVDADDWIDKDRIGNIVKTINATHADMVYSADMYIEKENNSVIKNHDIFEGEYAVDKVEEIISKMSDASKCFSHPKVEWALWLWTIKAEILKEKAQLIDDKIDRGEDLLMVWLSLFSSKKVAVVKNCTYHYFQRNNSITKKAINMEERVLWYQNVKRELIHHKASSNILKSLLVLMHWICLSNNYEMLNLSNVSYLYPYEEVKENSKIIVFGAGKFGKNMIRYIDKTKQYNVAKWVDNYVSESMYLGYKIGRVEEIKDVQYDYVIIAILSHQIADEIEKELLDLGVKNNKIKRIKPNCLREDVLFGNFEIL